MKQVVLLSFLFFLLACGDDKEIRSKRLNPININPDSPIRGTPGENLMLDEIPEVTDDNAASLTLSGTCIDGRGQVSLSVDSVVISDPVDCVNGRFQVTVDLSDLPTDTISIQIKVTQGTGDQLVTDTLPASVSINDPPPPQPIIPSFMELVDPQTSPSENFNPVIRVKDRQPGDRVELFTDSECKNAVAGEKVPEDATSVDLTVCELNQEYGYGCHGNKLTPGNYKFYERSSNSGGSSGCSTEYMEYFLTPDQGSPPEPKALSIESPNPGFLARPVIRVFGVIPGNRVTLHKDKFCNYPILPTWGSSHYNQVVEDGKSYIDIEPGVVSYNTGDYVIYAKTTNFYGMSKCSKSSVTYTLKRRDPPTNLSIEDTSYYPSRPIIKVSGVSPGDSVFLYRDSQCSESQMGYAKVPDNATSVDITVYGVSTDTTTFYANRSGGMTLITDCSTASVTYEYLGN